MISGTARRGDHGFQADLAEPRHLLREVINPLSAHHTVVLLLSILLRALPAGDVPSTSEECRCSTNAAFLKAGR
jgi:hypothetical protein